MRGGGRVTFLIIAAVAAALAWAVDVAVNPKSQCRACGGSGRHPLSRKGAYGDCLKCGATGRRLRFGARWLRPKLAKK